MTDYNKSQPKIKHSPLPSVKTLSVHVEEEEREKSQSIIKDFRSISEDHGKSEASKKVE